MYLVNGFTTNGMRKFLIGILFLIGSLSLCGQVDFYNANSEIKQPYLKQYWKHTKKNIPSYSLTFTAGFLNGIQDILAHKYEQSKFTSWGWNEQFWNAEISWINKCDPAINPDIQCLPKYFGSTTFLAWTTDGWHMTKTASLTTFEIGMLLRVNDDRRFKTVLLDLILTKIIFSAGWHLRNKLFLE